MYFCIKQMRKAGNLMIPLENCKDGYLYVIYARNALLGLYVAKRRGFRISRVKFGNNYEFVEYHWNLGEPHGTAKPYRELFKPEAMEDEQVFLGFMNKYYEEHYAEIRDILRQEDPDIGPLLDKWDDLPRI
jgi:hypothetical protein